MGADALIADKAHDADRRVIDPLIVAGRTSKVDSKVRRACDKHISSARRLIETFFAKSRTSRAIAACHEKTARNLLGRGHLAAAAIWLNRRHTLVDQGSHDRV